MNVVKIPPSLFITPSPVDKSGGDMPPLLSGIYFFSGIKGIISLARFATVMVCK